MRRQILGLPVLEQLYNGYTIERSVRLLETEITLPSHRSATYNTRGALCSLTDEQTLDISTNIAYQPTAIHKLNRLAEL